MADRMWTALIEFLRTHHRFLITTHVHPDGDALGAQIGLARFLRTLGKQTVLINSDPVPRIYRFLDASGTVRAYQSERDDPELAACDAAIVVDVASLERVGAVGEALRAAGLPTACIDHHVTNAGLGHVAVIAPTASSSSSLVLDLIRTTGRPPDAAVAEALYVGLATDTGWFRYANATPQAFHDAAQLVACGASPPRVYELVYENLSWPRTHLLARALATLRAEADGRIAYVAITRQMFDETGAADEEVEGFVDKLRELGGVEIILMFRETPDGGTKVSLRAKHDLDVGSLAASFGGGGHRRAAGITLSSPLAQVIPSILAAARRLLTS
ncbi:MAG TPA: bifunctional oligoribonuclease/PAP phosphatase NrnA [Planctomycetota bacterium]|nr:bifunctional oligoribonuclease/PAP phosphatase NrnA [Planctomycetota bacterium]HRT97229.1 bifunctional oligoribonuclease/PAP phosphatase NrnA [Planctomycetota bacterium]